MFLIFTGTTVLQNCTVTSPSAGTIRVSCDSPYQILVNITCIGNCNNPMVTIIGDTPLTVRELDPGMMYSVAINVFKDNQIILRDLMITASITVKNSLGEISIEATIHVTTVHGHEPFA